VFIPEELGEKSIEIEGFCSGRKGPVREGGASFTHHSSRRLGNCQGIVPCENHSNGGRAGGPGSSRDDKEVRRIFRFVRQNGLTHREAGKAGDFGGYGGGVWTGEEIDGDVVMVVVPREEAEGAPVGGEAEAEGFVELLGGFEVADGEVHVAEPSSGRETLPVLRRDCSDSVEVEGKSVHLNILVLPFPEFGGTVGVDFDAVAFGVGKIERFADEMISGANEIPTVMGRVLDKRAEGFAVREQDSEMKEAGSVGRAEAAVL